MVDLPADIEALISSEKEMAFRPKWDSVSDPRNLVMTASLTVGEITIGGFELRGRVSKQVVDRAAMLQLEYFASARQRIPLWRCQWRPFETHTNPGWGPKGFEFMEFEGASHSHDFIDNFVKSEGRMRAGNLPAARPINPDPSNLSDFIAFCGECFRIKNINQIEVPQIPADMFWMKDG